MSNQIDLNDLEDLKPLKNQDLDTVYIDSSNIMLKLHIIKFSCIMLL